MASLIPYTKAQLIERIKRHIANAWPTSSFSTTDNEILLYIDQALAPTVIGQVYQGAKVEGNLIVPEGWLTTYSFSVTQDVPSGFWYITLPQPPVSLPLGYSVSRVYSAVSGLGQSDDFVPIEAKRVGYRSLMQQTPGGRYWVEGSKMWLTMSDNSSLYDFPMYVQMVKTRTESLTETLNLPDDAIDSIFKSVVAQMIQRMQLPVDIIQDDLPAGNKGS